MRQGRPCFDAFGRTSQVRQFGSYRLALLEVSLSLRLTRAKRRAYLRMCSVTVMVNPEGEAIMVDLEELVSVILSPWTFLNPLDSRSA